MIQKSLIVLLVGGSVVLTACNTVRGAAKDVESAANCTENAMKRGAC
jgi:predicted small secreted protein